MFFEVAQKKGVSPIVFSLTRSWFFEASFAEKSKSKMHAELMCAICGLIRQAFVTILVFEIHPQNRPFSAILPY